MKKTRLEQGVILVVLLYNYLATVLAQKSKDDNEVLTAKELLQTIAPTNRLAKLPPGFPPLHKMNTDKFDYNTAGRYIRVVANLYKPVVMVKRYIELSNVGMNFTYDKKQPRNGTWQFSGQASWAIGSVVVHVKISENGDLSAITEAIDLANIAKGFRRMRKFNNSDIDPNSISLKYVRITGKVYPGGERFYVMLYGYLNMEGYNKTLVTITVGKLPGQKLQIYCVIEIKRASPAKILRSILHQRTLNVPFFAHLMSDSELLNSKKDIFGITISLNDVYRFNYNTTSGKIIRSVLKSHIPSGVTLLCPLSVGRNQAPIKTVLAIKRPNFDFVVDKKDKITISRVLRAVSSEIKPPTLPSFLSEEETAYTSHVSFDSDTTVFSLFIRLHNNVELIPGTSKSKISNVILQTNFSDNSSESTWKMSARGHIDIGKSKIRFHYTQIGDPLNKVFGFTGLAKKLDMADIMQEFDPEFYPGETARQMLENTEITDFSIEKVSVFSRITAKNTPHLLITGRTNLPAWEKEIQLAMLLMYQKEKWHLKMAISFVRSPLSNILQALTGLDSRDITLLHNTHIMTTIITSPLPSYSSLPPKIITTPLLRLPVVKGITVIALLKLPDNCGDDKTCQAAEALLGSTKIYTLKGELAMNGFYLRAPYPEAITISNDVVAVNNTLQFYIANDSRFDILSSLKLRRSDLVFEGSFHIYKTGQIQVDMQSKKKLWPTPFGLNSLAFSDLRLVTFYKPKEGLQKLALEGKVKLGKLGNGFELNAPLILQYNPSNPTASNFHANFSNIGLKDLMKAFTIDSELPYVLESASFPYGLMVSYSSIDMSSPFGFEIHGDISILGRILNCNVKVVHPGTVMLTTANSPAPVLLGDGQIIIQQDSRNKLRGPRLFASIDHSGANVTISGFVKVLGLEAETDVAVSDEGLKFGIFGKLMEYKETFLTAYSEGSLDDFRVSGCFEDVAAQVQVLLIEIISKASNQSTINMQKAEENFVLAQRYYERADREEAEIRAKKDETRREFESHLLEYGRFEVEVNDTCITEDCDIVCFGSPEWNRCFRRDIFGECVSSASWKKCSWRNIDPVCVAKHDGCHVIKTIAEKELAERKTQIIQERIDIDSLEQIVIDAEVNKGKHKAVLEAAIDAKRLVVEDSSPGLNAADAAKNVGPVQDWIQIDSVCYNTTIQQAATGCMYFQIKGQFYKGVKSEVSIASCLKEELVTELAESLANYIFPGIVDTSNDDVTDVANQMTTSQHRPQRPNLMELQLQNNDNGEMRPNVTVISDSQEPSTNITTEVEVVENVPSNDNTEQVTEKQGNPTQSPRQDQSEHEQYLPTLSDRVPEQSVEEEAESPSQAQEEQEQMDDGGSVSSSQQDLSNPFYQSDFLNPLFGGNSLQEEQMIEDALYRRGRRDVKEISNIRNVKKRKRLSMQKRSTIAMETSKLLERRVIPFIDIKSVSKKKTKVRKRRSIVQPLQVVNEIKKRDLSPEVSYTKLLFSNPFWEIKLDRNRLDSRSTIPMKPKTKLIMNKMIHKRWKIPDNGSGKCRIFHQLVDICKDMVDILIQMDSALTSTVKKYKKEKKLVTNRVKETNDFLVRSALKVHLNISVMMGEVEKTLKVVNQGVNIWASKCEQELNWQNTAGVQNWLTSMDLRIQELGGFGVYRFLENLFHAFEALFESATYSDSTAGQALVLLQRIRRISTGFDKIFKEKLSVRSSRIYATDIMHELNSLKHESIFCAL